MFKLSRRSFVFGGLALAASAGNAGAVTLITRGTLSANAFGFAEPDGTEGIFALGHTVTTTNKYTYSGDTVAAATSLERFQLNPDHIRMRRRILHIRSA